MTPQALPLVCRYTLALHVRAAAFEGAFAALLGLTDVVLVKGLAAQSLSVTALAVALPASMLFATVTGGLMVGRDRRRFLDVALAGRLALLFAPFVSGPWGLIALVAVANASYAIVIPIQNSLFQANYPPAHRGRIFARVQVLASGVAIVSALVIGSVLELDADFFRALYPVAGIAGAVSILYLRRIRTSGSRRKDRRGRPKDAIAALREAVAATVQSLGLLRDDAKFRAFEIGFMAYGTAFMMLQPMTPYILVHELHATYLQAALAKQGVFGLTNLAALPLMGRLNDAIGAVRAGGVTFALLIAYPLGLMLASDMSEAYVVFALYGVAMAGVNVVWTLGAISFAGPRDSAPYQGVHIALVGIRGVTAPLLGGYVVAIGEPLLGLVVAACLLVWASSLMWRLAALQRREQRATQAQAQAQTHAATPTPAPEPVAPARAGS